MSARISRIDPLDLYVTAIVLIGGGCMAWLVVSGADHYQYLLAPEVAIFALFALVGEFVPLKVFTRGAEGEVSTSTTFAMATMLVAGPLAAFAARRRESDRRRHPPQVAQEGRVQHLPVRD